ncbi:MAG: hypothetical protein WBL99_05035, partial [Candidatus Acidiferrales bacterium]
KSFSVSRREIVRGIMVSSRKRRGVDTRSVQMQTDFMTQTGCASMRRARWLGGAGFIAMHIKDVTF